MFAFDNIKIKAHQKNRAGEAAKGYNFSDYIIKYANIAPVKNVWVIELQSVQPCQH
jgi:hypothetical protein